VVTVSFCLEFSAVLAHTTIAISSTRSVLGHCVVPTPPALVVVYGSQVSRTLLARSTERMSRGVKVARRTQTRLASPPMSPGRRLLPLRCDQRGDRDFAKTVTLILADRAIPRHERVSKPRARAGILIGRCSGNARRGDLGYVVLLALLVSGRRHESS
jgi:hypothetical protein